MPQFDPASFASQIFWLVLLFGLLWLILARAGLPRVERIFEDRAQRISNDLEMAEKYSADAEQVQQRYEHSLDQARAAAQSVLADAHDNLAAKLAATEQELDARLSKRLDEAEARITQEKQAALSDVAGVAAEAASDLLAKLSLPTDAADVLPAVQSVLTEQKAGQ